ncbi:MAG: hypothetical protein ACRDNF_19390 [Streptosporangiaceae bacterium]
MRPRRAGVALAAPVLLLAAACGSQQAGAFHPTGVMAAAKPAASAAALVPFPGKVRFEFDALPPNSAQATVVSRDRAFLLAYYYAIYTRGRNTSYQSYIANSGVLTSVQTAVAEHVDAAQGFAGVDKHFDTTVTQPPSLPGDLDVNYCVDEAGLRYTDIRTGQSLGNGSAQGELYYYESDTFAKNGHGSWDLVGTLVTPYPTGQARECKP